MRIAEIIDQLCNHQISKSDAIGKIQQIVEDQRCCTGFDLVVKDVDETVDGYGVLNLHCFDSTTIKNKIKRSDRVKVIIKNC